MTRQILLNSIFFDTQRPKRRSIEILVENETAEQMDNKTAQQGTVVTLLALRCSALDRCILVCVNYLTVLECLKGCNKFLYWLSVSSFMSRKISDIGVSQKCHIGASLASNKRQTYTFQYN